MSEGAEGATGTATTMAVTQSRPQSKKQRQKAQKREALPAAAFATHKSELERGKEFRKRLLLRILMPVNIACAGGNSCDHSDAETEIKNLNRGFEPFH